MNHSLLSAISTISHYIVVSMPAIPAIYKNVDFPITVISSNTNVLFSIISNAIPTMFGPFRTHACVRTDGPVKQTVTNKQTHHPNTPTNKQTNKQTISYNVLFSIYICKTNRFSLRSFLHPIPAIPGIYKHAVFPITTISSNTRT